MVGRYMKWLTSDDVVQYRVQLVFSTSAARAVVLASATLNEWHGGFRSFLLDELSNANAFTFSFSFWFLGARVLRETDRKGQCCRVRDHCRRNLSPSIAAGMLSRVAFAQSAGRVIAVRCGTAH
ncbi:unnamed protein product [Angiostrongylus costaricensis]|uniref:Transposase n=1 Tax=Angiostrongylus costaricensis TaxID=334426 RepID=A0A0R3P9I0_ANGCS|nr:unnamed protein product [Angiostrongylus costaricensis]